MVHYSQQFANGVMWLIVFAIGGIGLAVITYCYERWDEHRFNRRVAARKARQQKAANEYHAREYRSLIGRRF